MSLEMGKITLDIFECEKCELGKTVKNKVVWRGTSEHPKILFIGEAPGCISGDSLIDVAFRDKFKFPDGIPIKDLVGKKNFYVYSYDKKNEKLVIGKVKKVWKTGRKKVCEVSYNWWFNTVDEPIMKENSIKASLNHPFLLKTPKAHDPFKGINENGINYLSINQGLKIDHSLQPFYRRVEKDYGYVGTSSDNIQKESCFLLGFKLGRKLEKHEQCHHKDENKLNDEWNNLELQTIKSHSSLHTKGENNCMNNSVIREKHKEIIQSEAYRKNMSLVMKEVLSNPETYNRRLIEIEKSNPKRSATLKEKYKEPVFYYEYLLNHQRVFKWSDEQVKIAFMNRFPNEEIPNINEDNHKIFSIIEFDYEDVYDMEVETYHNFAVNGIFVHNSEEDKTGIPFVGRSGKVLDEMIAYMEIEDYAIINRLKCRPPFNDDPTPHQLEMCHPFLLRQIEYFDPALIILLGKFANTGFGPYLKWGEIKDFEGHKYAKLYHPAALLYNSDNRVRQFAYMDELVKLLPELR